MEALAFGLESTQSCHSKFQCAGQSDRNRFVSEIVAGVESGARQPIHLCNNSMALFQGRTKNILSKPHRAETQTQINKPHRVETQTQINKPHRVETQTSFIVAPQPVGNYHYRVCQYESMAYSHAYRAGIFTRARVVYKYKSGIINRAIRKAERFLPKKSKLGHATDLKVMSPLHTGEL